MTKKEVVQKGFSILQTYNLNLDEIELIVDEVEKNSQIITKDAILDAKEKGEVFFDEGETLVLKGDYLKKIEEKISEIEEFDVLFTVLSVEATDGNHYQLVSVDKYNNVYVNFKLLKRLAFNEYYYIHLVNLKHEQYNLSNVLNILFRGMIPYATDYFKQQYSSIFEQYPIFKKLEILLMLFESVNGSFGDLKDRVYVYFLSKYRAYEKLKQELRILREKIFSRESGNLVLLKEDIPIKHKNFFKIRTSVPASIEEINEKTGLSYYQSIILNSLTYTNEYVLGLAGSGKTYMASVIAKIFLLFKAVWFANTRQGLPIQYISFSKESVQNSFLPKIKDFIGVYFEKNSDLTISHMNLLLSKVQDSYFSEEDFEKLKKLDAIFRNKKEIFEVVESMYEEEKHYEEIYEKILKKEEVKALLRVIKTLRKTKEEMSLAIKIKIILFKLLKKKNVGEAISFSKKILSILSEMKDLDVKSLKKIDYLEIQDILNKYSGFYSKKIKEHYESVSKLIKNGEDKKVLEINIDEIDYQNILFYVKNMYRLLPDNDIEKIKNSLQKLNHKTDESIDEKDYDNLNKVANVIAMPIDEIFNVPIKQKAFLTLIDEALVIDQFLYYSLFSRTLIAYSFGDINQMNLNFLYNKSALFEKIKNIYMKNKITDQNVILKKNIFLNDKYNVSSIWDAIFKMSDNVNLLIDNFRNIKYLVYTLIRTNPTYVSYIKQFVSKNKDVLSPDIVSKIENAETIDDMIEAVNVYNDEIIKFKDFQGNETEIPLIVFDTTNYDNRIELFKRFSEFISIQDFEIKNILVTSVFKQDAFLLKKDMDLLKQNFAELGVNVDVLPASKIQALEYDIVVLMLEDSNSRNYIIENDKLFNVIMSRAKKGFIVMCKIENCANNVISNIFQENNFQVISV